MTKLELVTREVLRIVTQDHTLVTLENATETPLEFMLFNTISGQHEIECFFAIEFEQEQVDAWTTVQNIIDDVMNLWVSPITDPVVKGANLETVQRLQRQLGESEKAFEERVLNAVGRAYQNDPMFIERDGEAPVGKGPTPSPHDPFISNPRSQIEPKINTDRAQVAAINRIERADVEIFRDEIELSSDCEYPNALIAYQRIATKSAIYPGKGTPFGLMYAALGLAEAGEVQNKVKKAFRDDGVIHFQSHDEIPEKDGGAVFFEPITHERRAQIIKELGGVMWYIAAVCDEIGATMSEVALQNLDELCGRGERNTLRGDGDNR